MRTILSFIFLILSVHAFPQASWTAQFPIKTDFEIGNSQTYDVNEFFKIDNLLFGSRYTVQSTVQFRVVDTTMGGYWLRYNVNSNAVRQRKDSSAYIIAELMDGITLFIYVKKGNVQLDSLSYHNTKKKIASSLDSIAAHGAMGKQNREFIQALQIEMKTDEGLGFLLGPLMLFEEYYSSKPYKEYHEKTEGKSVNIMNKLLFPGIIEKEWQSTFKDGTVRLNALFTGDPTQAAKYYRSIIEPLLIAKNIRRGKNFYPVEMRYISDFYFTARPDNSFPAFLSKKTVSEYLFRSVKRLEMIAPD